MSEEIEKAEKPKEVKTVKEMMQSESFQLAVQQALPETGCTIERFAKVAMTALTKNPDLKECTQASVAQCLIDLASLGIEADGRRAHLIPFNDRRKGVKTCTLILDYKGIVELVKRSGDVKDIQAHVVYKKDQFDVMYGTGAFIEHKPYLEGERGDAVCAYSHITMKDGSTSFEVMGIAEINKIRDDSRGYKPKDPDVPWNKWYGEMARKTVFKRHSKWLTLSPEVQQAISMDDSAQHLSVEERVKVAKPIIEPETIIESAPQEEDTASEE
jgi:recombination protein RecT